MIERWERLGKLILRRNPNYFHAAYLERLEVRFLPTPAERVASVRSGAVHFTVGLGEPEVAVELRQDSGLEVTARQGAVVEHLELRIDAGGHPALRNKLVRRALAYAIDRAAIVRELYGKVDAKLRQLDSMLFPTQSPAYAPNWRGYQQTLALARRLLEQAGCRRGADGIYVCGDRRLSLRFFTSAGAPVRERVLSTIQTQLRQVGIEVVPNFTSRAVLFNQILPSGEFDVALFNWGYAPESSGLKDIFACQAIQNYTGYCQRLVTRADQASRILDSGRRAEVVNRADRLLARDVPVIPLYQFVELAARRTSLRGVVHVPGRPLTGAEDCGSRASGGARRRAPRRRPGRGGAPGAETRRGGTLELVIALEPTCLNVLVSSCTGVGGVLEGAFADRCRPQTP